MSLSFAAVANLTMGYGTLLMLGGVIGYVQVRRVWAPCPYSFITILSTCDLRRRDR